MLVWEEVFDIYKEIIKMNVFSLALIRKKFDNFIVKNYGILFSLAIIRLEIQQSIFKMVINFFLSTLELRVKINM